jgi:hypothetical protein
MAIPGHQKLLVNLSSSLGSFVNHTSLVYFCSLMCLCLCVKLLLATFLIKDLFLRNKSQSRFGLRVLTTCLALA